MTTQTKRPKPWARRIGAVWLIWFTIDAVWNVFDLVTGRWDIATDGLDRAAVAIFASAIAATFGAIGSIPLWMLWDRKHRKDRPA